MIVKGRKPVKRRVENTGVKRGNSIRQISQLVFNEYAIGIPQAIDPLSLWDGLRAELSNLSKVLQGYLMWNKV